MGKKYIIELLDDCQSEFKGIMALGLTQEKQISVELIPEEGLRPYTESDLEQVRKEAYDKGYEDAEEKYNDGYSDGYDAGLSDAWDAARKIWEYDTTTLRKIFGDGIMRMDWFMRFTASEAIEKIRQYEQEKDRQARIEFNCEEIKDVLNTTVKECNVSLDEIAAVLEKMREGQE